jgi:hypothetical protein
MEAHHVVNIAANNERGKEPSHHHNKIECFSVKSAEKLLIYQAPTLAEQLS